MNNPSMGLSLALSPSPGILVQPTATNRPSLLLTFKRCRLIVWSIFRDFLETALFFLPLSLFSLLSPKDTAVSGAETWLWFGFSKAMGHAGLFFPHSGLLSGVFALTCVQLGLLYPHYWLQVMFWTQSSWPRRGLRYIIVRRGTSGDWTEAAAHVLSSLTLSSRWIFRQRSALDTGVWRGDSNGETKKKPCRRSADKHPRFGCCFLDGHPCTAHLRYFTFSSRSLIRNLNMQSC